MIVAPGTSNVTIAPAFVVLVPAWPGAVMHEAGRASASKLRKSCAVSLGATGHMGRRRKAALPRINNRPSPPERESVQLLDGGAKESRAK